MQSEKGEEMPFKPSDFFLGIVTFLGVLLPGAVFMALRGQQVLAAFAVQGCEPRWIGFTVAAYIAGQMLLAVTDPLNELAIKVAAKMPYFFPKTVLSETHEEPGPPKATTETPKTADFHEALSYVRLRNTEAAGEIDRHMADYKLLRNLIAVFFIDLLWSLLAPPRNYSRAIWDGGLMLLSFIGFVRMHYWARLFAVQYKDLLPATEKPAAAQK